MAGLFCEPRADADKKFSIRNQRLLLSARSMADWGGALLAAVGIVVVVLLAFVVWPAVIGWRYRDRPMAFDQRRRLARSLVGLGIVSFAMVPLGLALGARPPYLGMIGLILGGLSVLINGIAQFRILKKEQSAQVK